MRDIRPQENQPFEDDGDDIPRLPKPVSRLPGSGQSEVAMGKDIRRTPIQPFPKKPIGTANRLPGTTVPVSSVNVIPPEKIIRSAPAPVKKVAGKTTPRPAIRLGHRERKVVLVLLVLVALAGGLAAFIFLPKASIKLILRTAPLLVDQTLTIQAQNTQGENTIPGSAFFREVQIEDSATAQSTQVIGTKASGTVQIVNRTLEEQKIKEQSRLVTKDGTLFYMQRSVNVPPNSSVPVAVEAAEAGEGGNIQPQRLDFAALDTSAQSVVYGQASAAIAGGSGSTVAIVKESDIELARTDAGQKARAKIEQEIRDELPEGWIILEESWAAELPTFETAVAVDTQQPTIPYTARVIVRVIGYEQAALENNLRAVLESRLDQEFMLFPGPLSYTITVNSVDWEQAVAAISARVTHTTIADLSLETLRGKLAGQKETAAKTYLGGLPGVRSVDLQLWPFWAQNIPRIEKRIQLEFEPEKRP